MKRFDKIIIAIIVVISIGSYAFMKISKNKSPEGIYVQITLKGKVYKKIPLTQSTDEKITVESNLGKNIVEIKNGKVRINESDCKNQICVKTGYIGAPGDVIACLPHELLVEIKEK